MDWLGIARKLIWFFSPCRFPEEAEEGSTVSAGGQNTHMDDNVREYSSLLGSGTINERWQSTSHGLKIALVVIAVLSVVALAFFIATIVLAAKGTNDTTTVLPCPVRHPPKLFNIIYRIAHLRLLIDSHVVTTCSRQQQRFPFRPIASMGYHC